MASDMTHSFIPHPTNTDHKFTTFETLLVRGPGLYSSTQFRPAKDRNVTFAASVVTTAITNARNPQ